MSGRPSSGDGRGRRQPSAGSTGRNFGGRGANPRGRATVSRSDAPPPVAPRKPWSADGDLPRWIQEEVARVTAKHRVPQTVELLQTAARAFSAGKHGKAAHLLEEAKELSPRTATIRELLGLSAYRLGRWEQALRELRTFRRLTGDTTHMPVEMDVLRALERPLDVESTWQSFRRIGGDRETEREARVVYGSFLLDQGQDQAAWELTSPKRIGATAHETELRVWFVAARAASRLGDRRTARRLYEAIQAADPGFPGLDELDRATMTDDRRQKAEGGDKS